MSHKANTFLDLKVLETIGEYGVPALAAAVVTSMGADTASAQDGIRKVGGGSGVENWVQKTDKFNLGSISKVVTGFLMTKLIQDYVGGLQWETKISDVFPELASLTGWQEYYGKATVAQLMSHTAGFPNHPTTDDAWDWKNYTPGDESTMNTYSLMQRRYLYVELAVVDPPLYGGGLGNGFVYDGGGIICAAMAEEWIGETYAQLVKEYVFGPLGMVHSGFGRLYRGYPDIFPADGPIYGPWQHTWDATSRRVEPDPDTMLPGYNWDPRAPVGDVAMSAGDMARFLVEQVSDHPIVVHPDKRSEAQTTVKTGTYVQGGWGGTVGPVTQIAHEGDNGVSVASATVRLGSYNDAYAAMSNVNTLIGGPALAEMNAVSLFMLAHWQQFFAASSPEKFVACDHPCPALTIAADITFWSPGQQGPGGTVLASGPRMVFARKHDGAVQYTKSTDGGANWSTPAALPDAVIPNVKSPIWSELSSKTVPLAPPTDLINSGLAACISASGDRCYLFGRKPDKRIWFRRSTDVGATWEPWQAIGDGLFLTGPAAAASANGKIVHVCAVGLNQKLYWSRSVDGGTTWSNWALVGGAGGDGPFTSAPALAMSPDGQILSTFARQDDWRIWYNQSWYHQSPDGGIDWSEWLVVADWELSDQGTIVNVATSSAGPAGCRPRGGCAAPPLASPVSLRYDSHPSTPVLPTAAWKQRAVSRAVP